MAAQVMKVYLLNTRRQRRKGSESHTLKQHAPRQGGSYAVSKLTSEIQADLWKQQKSKVTYSQSQNHCARSWGARPNIEGSERAIQPGPHLLKGPQIQTCMVPLFQFYHMVTDTLKRWNKPRCSYENTQYTIIIVRMVDISLFSNTPEVSAVQVARALLTPKMPRQPRNGELQMLKIKFYTVLALGYGHQYHYQ